ncbi:MAG TPA: hypothetical protein VHE30_02480 [Polyangiaceae bacterium]|nr:hypothetical protein [Polyangiaceae bacterium]
MSGRSALVAILALALGFSGCERLEQALRDRSAPEAIDPGVEPSARHVAAVPSSEARNVVDAGPPAVRLDPAVRRKMKLLPRRASPGTIAFGKGRLGLLLSSGLGVHDATHFGSGFVLPLSTPRAVTALADGSLVATGQDRTVRLLPHDQKPKTASRMLLLPESSLFGDRVAQDRVWVLPGSGKTLYGYDVSGGATLFAPAEWLELPDFDRRAFGSARDGSFVYTTPSGVLQFYGKGAKKPLAGDVAGVVRFLPASRPDTLWMLSARSGKLVRLLAGKLYTLATVAFEADLSDADAAGDRLAVLELVQPDDAPWSFVIEAFDVSGARKGRTTLPAEESLDPGWESRLLRDRAVALSVDPPLVAVGGPEHLDVFDGTLEKTVFSGAARPGP